MKKRDKSLTSMNRTINLSVRKNPTQTKKQETINPWVQMEKKWDVVKAAKMPPSLSEICAQQDLNRKKQELQSAVENHPQKNAKINPGKVTKLKHPDTSQTKLSFGQKRKHIETEVYCEITTVKSQTMESRSFQLHETISHLDLDFHIETTNQIRKFIAQSSTSATIRILLITGQHGAGKSWCINHVLSSTECEKSELHDICDPSSSETNIRSVLLGRGIKKKIVVLDDIDAINKDFWKQFLVILSKMLMPLKNVVRKNIQRVTLVPNLIIMTAVNKYHKNTRKLIDCFGIGSTKVQKITPAIQQLFPIR